VAVAAAGLGSAAWTYFSGLAGGSLGWTETPTGATATPGLLESLQLPLWTFQAIAAAPYRNNPAPAPVYLLFLLVLAVALWLGWRDGSRRNRVATAVACVLGLLVPAVLVAATLSTWGGNWQGRYALPFLVGVPLLASWSAPARAWAEPGRRRWVGLALVAAWVLANLLSVLHVRSSELGRAVSRDDSAWAHGPVLLTVALAVLGGLCLAGALWSAGRGVREATPASSLVDAPA